MNQLDQAYVYTDFKGLADLKQAARSDSPAALQAVAKQFEGIFYQMMLKSMREANLGDGIFDSQQSKLYQSMYDQQLSLDLAKRGGLGFAETIVQQMSPKNPHAAAGAVAPKGGYPVPPRQLIEQVRSLAPNPTPPTAQRVEESGSGRRLGPASATRPASAATQFSSPRQFVSTLWPLAREAAGKLGVKPEVLIAQAALETGWGKHITSGGDGSSSYNLFNIKADRRWNGATATVNTVEYRDGKAVKGQAAFRAYGSYAESFRDYVDFLKSNPRYGDALQQAGDPQGFIDGLQKAGYATDPNYADKINTILNGEVLGAAAGGSTAEVPLA